MSTTKTKVRTNRIPSSNFVGQASETGSIGKIVDGELDTGSKHDLAVAQEETELPLIKPSLRRRVNQRWFYELILENHRPAVPTLPKRRSKPPQRLTASRLGMVIRVPDVPNCLDSSSTKGSSASPSEQDIAPSTTSTEVAAAVSQLVSIPFHTLRESPGSPPPYRPPRVEPSDDVPTNEFTIRLLFPDGEAPTLIYTVYQNMPVSLLRLRLSNILEALFLVHLLVGPSWTTDILEHDGAITDRFFPGTDTPCPYLQRGSRVLVYFTRPATGPPVPPVPVPIGLSSLDVAPATGGWFSSHQHESKDDESKGDDLSHRRINEGRGKVGEREIGRDMGAGSARQTILMSCSVISPPWMHSNLLLLFPHHHPPGLQRPCLIENLPLESLDRMRCSKNIAASSAHAQGHTPVTPYRRRSRLFLFPPFRLQRPLRTNSGARSVR